jgi:hypothetical protein
VAGFGSLGAVAIASFNLVGTPNDANTFAEAFFLDDLTITSLLEGLDGLPGTLYISYTLSGVVSSTGKGNAFAQVTDYSTGSCPPIAAPFCPIGTQSYSTTVSGTFAATPISFIFGETFPFGLQLGVIAGTDYPVSGGYHPNSILGTGTGDANFYDTVTISGLMVTDAVGNPVPGATFISESGTQYPVVPEPTSLTLLGAGLFVAVWRSRRPRPRSCSSHQHVPES